MARVSVLGLVLLVWCSMLQHMGVEAKAGATEEDWMNTATCMPVYMTGTYDFKKSSSTTKRTCSSPPKFLVTYRADNNKPSVYTLEPWWCCWRPKDSLLACLRAKISRRRWTFYLARKRVCQNNQKLGFCDWENLDREPKWRRRSHPILSWCTRRTEKNEASARWKFLVFVRA